MSYILTIHVDHAEFDPVTIEMYKVDESHVSIKVSPQGFEEVKPIKGIQQELFKSIEQYYKTGLQSLSFTISQVGKKRIHEVASFDAESKLSSAKLSKAIKESITKVKSSQVKTPKKQTGNKHTTTLVHPKRRNKHAPAAVSTTDVVEENDDALSDEEDHLVVNNSNNNEEGGKTIVDGQGAIKKVKKQSLSKVNGRQKQQLKANVQAVPKVNHKGRVQKNVAVVGTAVHKGARGARAPAAKGLKGAVRKSGRATFSVSPSAVPVDATAAPVMNNGGAIAPPQVIG